MHKFIVKNTQGAHLNIHVHQQGSTFISKTQACADKHVNFVKSDLNEGLPSMTKAATVIKHT